MDKSEEEAKAFSISLNYGKGWTTNEKDITCVEIGTSNIGSASLILSSFIRGID